MTVNDEEHIDLEKDLDFDEEWDDEDDDRDDEDDTIVEEGDDK